MSIFYVKNSQINNDCAFIDGKDVNHIKNVLRYEAGQELYICNEDGCKYKTIIKEFKKDSIDLHIEEKCDNSSEPSINITLFQGMPKSDKLEFIIQKCTELRCLGICSGNNR